MVFSQLKKSVGNAMLPITFLVGALLRDIPYAIN